MIRPSARVEFASQAGFGLIEVLVSAVVLVTVALGVFAGLDAVTGTAGANKARTIAATLAERDQERLRGMRTLDIDEMNLEPYDVKVGNVTYNVVSKAAWVNDASSDELSCGVDAGQASYMRISSTVTSPATGAAVKPVELTSIVAPQVGAASAGSLAVLVKGAAGQPIPNVSVSLSPGGKVELTNALGCAVFGQLTAGGYDVTLDKGGYVDKEGVLRPSQVANVAAGAMSTIEFAYDAAASIAVHVEKPSAEDEPSRSIVAANGGLGAGYRTDWIPSNPIAALDDGPLTVNNQSVTYLSGDTFVIDRLFPFTNGYTIYSGTCLGADPTKNGLDDYFDSNPGKVNLQPGEVVTAPLIVREPPADITVKRNGVVGGARVYAYPTKPGCEGGARIYLGTTSSQNGKVTYNGLPYGTYLLCATNGRKGTASITIDSPSGASTDVDLGGWGSCGATAP